MSDYRLTFTLTKAERNEHIADKRRLASMVADRIEQGVPLEDWQTDFLRFILNESGNPDDHAGAMRAWADSYQPGKRRGPANTFCSIDAAEGYALHREEGRSHTAALQLLETEFGVTRKRLREAIAPQLPHVCAHLGIPIETVSERKPLGRPRKR
jgi:hypothetical protein